MNSGTRTADRTGIMRGALTRSVLSDETYAAIRDLLLEYEILPKQRVNIDALSVRLGVSPTPVREALARLESDGLVIKTPLRGYSATALLSPREFIELSQFRVIIEQWTAENAALAPYSSPSTLADEIAAIRTETAQLGSGPLAMRSLLEHDARFHGMVAALAGNDLVRQSFERTHFHMHFLRLFLAARGSDGTTVDTISTESSRSAARAWEQEDQISHTISQHAAIAEAITRGDGFTAARLMQEHIEESRRRTLPLVEALQIG